MFKIFTIIFLLVGSAYAGDQYPATCSVSDVQSAINAVRTSGSGTVFIPAGDCTWASTVTITATSTQGTGTFTIMGSGPTTTIRTNTSFGSSSGAFTLGTSPSNAPAFVRISNIHYQTPSNTGSYFVYAPYVQVLRIDHNIAKIAVGYGKLLKSYYVAKLLIDHNYVDNIGSLGSGCYSDYGIEFATMGRPQPVPTTGGGDCRSVCNCIVGDIPHNRTSSVSSGNTVVSALSSSNTSTGWIVVNATAKIDKAATSGTGKIKNLYIHIASISGSPSIDVSTLQLISGNTLSSRSVVTGLTVTRGLNKFTDGTDFNNLTVNHGDYLGAYLNNCAISAGTATPASKELNGTTANAHWAMAGNQFPAASVDFGAKQNNNISLWAEIYDDDNQLKTCWDDWATWLTSTHSDRNSGMTACPKNFDNSYVPSSSDDCGVFVEDNYTRWTQSILQPNWANLQKFTVRYNNFLTTSSTCTVNAAYSQVTSKAGTVFFHAYNNQFNTFSISSNDISFDSGSKAINMVDGPTGMEDFTHIFTAGDTINISGTSNNNGAKTISSVTKYQIITNESLTTEAAGNTVNVLKNITPAGGDIYHDYAANGLFHDNIINNRTIAWNFETVQAYSSVAFPPLTYQLHKHFWNNTGNNVTCGNIDSAVCSEFLEGNVANGLVNKDSTYFYRAPQAGDALYGYTTYQYPHALSGGVVEQPSGYVLPQIRVKSGSKINLNKGVGMRLL